ncbi:MAG: hypothetical protein AAGF47_12360 [Planctomycetota bacterium]
MISGLLSTTLAYSTLEQAVADEIRFVILFGAIVTVVFCVTIANAVRKSISVRQREQTKRELAAYVAEGSMSPDDAHRILTAGEGDDMRELVLKRAADGWISAKKADQILKTLDAERAKPA